MFEQSILLPDPNKKRWTFAASILVEVSAVSVLLLIPLIFNERLGLGWIESSTRIEPPMPRPIPVQTPSDRVTSTRTVKPWSPLFVSMNHLRPIEVIDGPDDVMLPQPCPTCVVDSISSGVLNSIGGPAGPAPPPQPRVKQ